jgi:hypothetical protein
MGGQGSGWQGIRKWTVEDGLILGVKDLVAKGAAFPSWRKGSLAWRSGAETVATLEFDLSTHSDGTGTLWLRYAVDGKPMHYTITLVSTVPHYGGRRLWFICPNTKSRVAKLYLPPDAEQFGSRKAHDLSYRSCQSSFRLERARRQTESLARQMIPEAEFDALLNQLKQA